MRERGKLIAFEGIDGAGKSCQMAQVTEYLQMRGYKTVNTREPGGTDIGVQIRKLLLNVVNGNMHPHCELLLYAADRSQHVDEIIAPALSEGKIVLTDRYALSTVAYQGYGRHLEADLIEQLNQIATSGLKADLTFVFDIDRETAAQRIASGRNGNLDRLEKEDASFFERVRQGFLDVASKDEERIKVIDGRGSEDEVFVSLKPHLEALGL